MTCCLVVLAFLVSAGLEPAPVNQPRIESDPVVLELRAAQSQALSLGDRALARELEARIQQHCLRTQGRDKPVELHNTVLADPTEDRADAPDGLIREGTIQAFATDYQMDGTIWVASAALQDSFFDIHKSTNHGMTWQRVVHTTSWVSRRDRLGLVVGEGDSAFVYLFLISTYSGDGDLGVVRYTLDGYPVGDFSVLAGPDTVNNLLVCRDYTGDNYWLYAMTGDDDETNEFDEPILRSADYGKTWLVLDTFHYSLRGSMSFGAGTWLYCATAPGPLFPGYISTAVNTFYGAPGYWRYGNSRPDTFRTAGPGIAAAFTTPESTAVAWVAYSHDYMNSGDWDVLVSYSTNGGEDWSTPGSLAGSPAADEDYVDLRNYTSLGNPYVNASYISEQGADRRVYRHYANAGDPGAWSDTARINEHSAGTGATVRPRLVYSPGSPGTGAGCVFTGLGCENLYWNAPWFASIGERPTAVSRRPVSLAVAPNPCRGDLVIRWSGRARSLRFVDAAGRLVNAVTAPSGSEFVWRPTLASGLRAPAGVYFITADTESGRSAAAVVLR